MSKPRKNAATTVGMTTTTTLIAVEKLAQPDFGAILASSGFEVGVAGVVVVSRVVDGEDDGEEVVVVSLTSTDVGVGAL